jgi:type I restriction enzyme M protein
LEEEHHRLNALATSLSSYSFTKIFMTKSFSDLANHVWSVADLLRGDYKQSDYGKVILPFTLLRRLECVLESTKEAVVTEYERRKTSGVVLDPILKRKSGLPFYNVSAFTLEKVLADSKNIRANLVAYVSEFSEDARDVFERFKFTERIAELDDKDLLFQVAQSFANVDLHPDLVPNDLMGLVFEELIRKFAELSNETAGEHFTPREVVRLIVHCLFAGDDEALSKPGVVRSMYDPTAGTGGILSVGEATAKGINASAIIRLFGQELNDESYAICKADLLIKGQDPASIKRGNTLSADGHAGTKFDYGAANPPFGVDWKKVKDFVEDEHKRRGYAGRFGPGLPRISDGSLLFLMHLIDKMRPAEEGGGRVGIVLNGSPLFTGDAGSGESEIRRWILERDLLEAIIALPNDLFFNTGIATYIWVLSNHKSKERKKKVQLIDATRMYAKMKKSLGNKRVYITDEQIDEIVSVYSGFEQGATFVNEFKDNGKGAAEEQEPARVVSKIFDTTFFGYRKVTIDRPPQPGKEVKVKLKKGQKPYDPDLRDTENIPLGETIEAYVRREVLPHVPDAFVNVDVVDEKDGNVGKVGYEINFNRYFYVYKPPRAPHVIADEIREMEKRFVELMKGVLV